MLAIGLAGFCQKVTSDKFKINYKQYPLVKLPNELKSFSSNHVFLKFFEKERAEGGSYHLSGKLFPMVKHQNIWGEEIKTPGMNSIPNVIVSQPMVVKVTDKAGQLIYYRIFNTPFQEEPERFAADANKLDNMFRLTDASAHLSQLFEDRIDEISLKLFSIEKSTTHDDIINAYNVCLEGVNLFNQGQYAEGKEKFSVTVEAWNKALAEADIKNKKARVNKDVADALYKNLIQILPFVDQYDRALDLVSEYYKVIGGFGSMFTEGKRGQIKTLALNHKADISKGALKFAELENASNMAPLKVDDKKVCPATAVEINNLLVGSWRFYFESYKLPKNPEAEKLTRGMTSECNNAQWIHLSPDGTCLLQEGSWETSCAQKMDNSAPYWKVAVIQGRKFLYLAMEKKDLENPGMLTMFEIIHLSKDQLVIVGRTYPDHDTTTESVIQLQRVGFL